MKHPRLLIVEDDAHLACMVAFAARSRGWNTVDFGRPFDALRYSELPEADVVLSDLHLPDVNGLTFLGHLRATGWGGVAVIMTGAPHLISLDDRGRYGIAAVLSKPFAISELFRILEAVGKPVSEPHEPVLL